MNFKKVQNQTSNEATITQKVNGNLKRKRRKHSNLWPSRCAAGKNEWAWADFFSSSILIIQHLKRAYAALKVQGYAFWSYKDIEWVLNGIPIVSIKWKHGLTYKAVPFSLTKIVSGLLSY